MIYAESKIRRGSSDEAGDLVTTYHPDAFGNSMADWETGLWTNTYSARAGWHHNTKEFDGDVGLVYMYQRWYQPELGTFASQALFAVSDEHPYLFTPNCPTLYLDANGMFFSTALKVIGAMAVGCGTGAAVGVIGGALVPVGLSGCPAPAMPGAARCYCLAASAGCGAGVGAMVGGGTISVGIGGVVGGAVGLAVGNKFICPPPPPPPPPPVPPAKPNKPNGQPKNCQTNDSSSGTE